jgi:WD40 repeat protein
MHFVYCTTERWSCMIGDFYGSIGIWNLIAGLKEMSLYGHGIKINAIVVKDNSRICSCSDNDTIKLWNTTIGVCERTLEGHKLCCKYCITIRWKAMLYILLRVDSLSFRW